VTIAGAVQRSRTARTEAAVERAKAAGDREAGAREREQAEHDRATARAERDAGADARDEGVQDRAHALSDRSASAADRRQAERDRGTARDDRGAGARERGYAATDRSTARADRAESAAERLDASLDGLTTAYVRGAGLLQLAREISRSARAEAPLTVAYVDVDHLKEINDSYGHSAGDRMLVQVVTALKGHLRVHDLVIRYGGDEFVCAIPGLTEAESAIRFDAVRDELAASDERGSIPVGLAEMQPSETPDELIARADRAMYESRRGQRGH
jgi:diguanylate cyclase (GGDEF)-like protein